MIRTYTKAKPRTKKRRSENASEVDSGYQKADTSYCRKQQRRQEEPRTEKQGIPKIAKCYGYRKKERAPIAGNVTSPSTIAKNHSHAKTANEKQQQHQGKKQPRGKHRNSGRYQVQKQARGSYDRQNDQPNDTKQQGSHSCCPRGAKPKLASDMTKRITQKESPHSHYNYMR